MVVSSQKCKAKNRKQVRCGNWALKGADYCYIHSFGKFKNIPLLKNPTFHLIIAIFLAIIPLIISQVTGATKENQKLILRNQEEIKNIVRRSDSKIDTVSIKPFELIKNSFNILILPFEPLQDCLAIFSPSKSLYIFTFQVF